MNHFIFGVRTSLGFPQLHCLLEIFFQSLQLVLVLSGFLTPRVMSAITDAAV
jgi:hypothetical protein